jgi:integrase
MDLSTLKAPEEQVDAIYLNWQEISAIYYLDLSAYPRLRNSRDIFVLGCLTGMRFSDYSKIDPVNIKGGFLQKKQQKTEGWVFVPLRPEAMAILARFNGKVPSISHPKFSRHIRLIGELAGLCEEIRFSYKRENKTIEETWPKFEWISTHTARRSFCTNEFLAGTPVELIMKISGHKSLSDFYKYIRITPEEAGRKMQAIWESRGQLLTLEGTKDSENAA